MVVELTDENEIIELLRRIAEIVVLCERRAGRLLAKMSLLPCPALRIRTTRMRMAAMG